METNLPKFTKFASWNNLLLTENSHFTIVTYHQSKPASVKLWVTIWNHTFWRCNAFFFDTVNKQGRSRERLFVKLTPVLPSLTENLETAGWIEFESSPSFSQLAPTIQGSRPLNRQGWTCLVSVSSGCTTFSVAAWQELRKALHGWCFLFSLWRRGNLDIVPSSLKTWTHSFTEAEKKKKKVHASFKFARLHVLALGFSFSLCWEIIRNSPLLWETLEKTLEFGL